MAVVGIDLGTTNSLVAVYKDGESILIPNKHGDIFTPSAVGVDKDGNIVVGKMAKDMLITSPDSAASLFKRNMGTKKAVKLGKKSFLPEELSSFVIRKLIEDAQDFLGETVTEAIISVPAYFDAKKRAATKLAGQLAGIKVERLTNEPSAAALACRDKDEETFIVFDFGGGTLDVSVVEAFDNVISICAISGNNYLGGSDFDRAIVQEICKEKKIDIEKLSLQDMQVLLSIAEKAKIELTKESQVPIQANIGAKKIEYLLTNEKLYEISDSIFSKIKKPIQSVINDSKLGFKDIDRCILVGGSCHMPVVVEYLENLLRVPVVISENPEEIVAKGLGVYVGIKERNDTVRDVVLADICPFSLNANVHNENNPNKELSHTLIPRNSTLPISRTDRLYTLHLGQRSMRINVNQGEEIYADDNLFLGRLDIKIPLNMKEHESCEITYYYDINAILIVHVKVISSKEEYKLVLTGDGLQLSDKEVEKYITKIKSMKLSHEEQADRLLEQAKALYVQCRDDTKEYIKQLIAALERNTIGSIRVRKESLTLIKSSLDEFEKHINRSDIFNRMPSTSNLIDLTKYLNEQPPEE
ncbi:MAG: Hsp70 family protein [Defluviitaleaceae bacterium]|nr:Hsp70 family protein [Defluviitaleaceae bacterium]